MPLSPAFMEVFFYSNTTNFEYNEYKKNDEEWRSLPIKNDSPHSEYSLFFSVPTAQLLTPNSRMINTGILIFSVLIVALSLTFFNIILEFVTYVPLLQKCNVGASYCINFVTCSHNLPITLQHKKQKFENNHSHFY